MWYEGEIVTSFLIAISFTSLLFGFIIKMDTTLFVSAGGLYKETKICALTDTIVNLVLSLILINYFGIAGVIIATTISVFIAEYIFKTIVVHKIIFKLSASSYFIKNIKFFVLYIVDLIGSYYIISLININNIFIWFLVFVIFTLINAMIIFYIFYLFKEINFIKRFKLVSKVKIKNKK